MTQKTGIVGELGEEALILPALVEQALVANDRAKYYFTLLQAARQRAECPDRFHPALRTEREIAGIGDVALDEAVPGAVRIGDERYRIPHLDRILEGTRQAVEEMMRPFAVAASPDADALAARWEALSAALRSEGSGEIGRAGIGAIASGDRSTGDSPHLLVMDLHRRLTALLAGLTSETLDGARAYLLGDGDRALVLAFMRGLNRTAPLKFGHPGLGTTAIRAGDRLLIQNDIGETGAHVLVVSVAGTAVTVTCTDVHLPRLSFLRSLLHGWELEWSETVSRPVPNPADGGVYHLVVGRFAAVDPERRSAFLEHLGSQIVFLIDWNKARRQLRAFLSNEDAMAVLGRAAAAGFGHRAFLELGGTDLLDGALESAAEEFRQVGGEQVATCLDRVLKIAAEGLVLGEPRPILRDRCRAEILRALEAARGERLERCTAHAALVLEVALALQDAVAALQSGSGTGRVVPNAMLARRREREGDRLAAGARDILDLIAAQDDALDALEEASWYATLLDDGAPPPEGMAELTGLAVSAGTAYLRALSAAGTEEFFMEADRVAAIGREWDEARFLPASSRGDRRLQARTGFTLSLAASLAALTKAIRLLRDGAVGSPIRPAPVRGGEPRSP